MQPSKRKRDADCSATYPTTPTPMIDLIGASSSAELSSPSKKKKASPSKRKKSDEKRLKTFRSRPPQTYLERLRRAQEQRMYVIDRHRDEQSDVPNETFELAGTTGNIYTVEIGLVPECNCPDSRKGNQCKHIILHNVLKAPEHLQYQLAFLSTEIREIFAGSPAPPTSQVSAEDSDPNHPSNRKAIEGDCPICFTEFESDEGSIVWCKAACGNNIHKASSI
ncbi:hypothetical protein MMC25_005375 [Agyrium rufum]|nr:hypothetical protein [Agyrium rufum]